MDDVILSVQDLTLAFPTQGKPLYAVKNVSFDLKEGSSLGIVGESGSGKSMTARSVINLLPPNAFIENGHIYWQQPDGSSLDLLKASFQTLRQIRGNQISMIFQEPMTSLNPVYTCGNQVIENIYEHEKVTPNEAKERVLTLFDEVKLPDPQRIYKSYPHELSGGQRQRVMIAMALSCYPKLLIADEPTTALDVTVQKSILELLYSLKEKYRMSLIFISHDLGVISEIADEVAVMYQGSIIEMAPLSDIISSPSHAYTKGLISCRPSVHEKPHRLPTLSLFMEGPDMNAGEKEDTIMEQEPPEEEKKVLFRIEKLSKIFPLRKNFFGQTTRDFTAVDQLTFDIFQGETLGVVGESGSGKTTLGRMLMYLLSYEKGSITYKDRRLSEFSRKEFKLFRQNVQIIFQDPYSSLNPRMSVGQIVEEPLRYYKLVKGKKNRKAQTIQLLEDVRLDESFYDRYPHELSGGQRQRVAIARVLALNPEFIICDEAVSALDVSIQAEILNLLQDLKYRYHLTYVFISHDFAVVRFMSDRIAVMKDGTLVELERADRLFRSAQSPYTKTLLDSVPSF